MKNRLAILALLAMLAIPASLFAQTDTETLSVADFWNHNGYNVTQFSTGERYESFEQLPNGGQFRDQGILLFAGQIAGTNSFELLMQREHEKSVVATGYMLPTHIMCYTCPTSRGLIPHPGIRTYNNDIIVKKDSGWYLLDPVTLERILILTNEDIPDGTYHEFSYGFNTYTVGVDRKTGKLFAVAQTSNYEKYNGSVTVPSYLIVDPYDSDTSDLIPTYQDVIIKRSVTKFSYAGDVPEYLHLTSALKSGHVVGQIDSGVYTYKDGVLTKIGYAKRNLRGRYGPVTFTPVTPLAFGEQSIGWIGEDDNMYIAHVNESMPHTGVLDVPTNVPFRTQNNPAVYLRPDTPGWARTEVFETVEKYIERFNDPNFERVIWIPNDAAGL